jgi:hypothetical protein
VAQALACTAGTIPAQRGNAPPTARTKSETESLNLCAEAPNGFSRIGRDGRASFCATVRILQETPNACTESRKFSEMAKAANQLILQERSRARSRKSRLSASDFLSTTHGNLATCFPPILKILTERCCTDWHPSPRSFSSLARPSPWASSLYRECSEPSHATMAIRSEREDKAKARERDAPAGFFLRTLVA